jgi:toxin ParE1/3/4
VKLRYTLPALADLDEILSYISARSPQGALRVQARIQSVIDLLLDYPGVGSVTTDPTIRRMTTSPYPYLIFYEVSGDELIIHAVRHGARNPTSMPGAG